MIGGIKKALAKPRNKISSMDPPNGASVECQVLSYDPDVFSSTALACLLEQLGYQCKMTFGQDDFF